MQDLCFALICFSLVVVFTLLFPSPFLCLVFEWLRCKLYTLSSVCAPVKKMSLDMVALIGQIIVFIAFYVFP